MSDSYPQYPRYPQGSGGSWNAGKPGVIPLRPLTMGEIFGGALTTMRSHAGVVFPVSAAVAVVSAVLYLIVDLWILDVRNMPTIDPNAPPSIQAEQAWAVLEASVPGLWASLGITLLTQAFLAGFLTIVVGRAVLGTTIGFGEAWEELRPRLLPLFGLAVVVTVLTALGLVAFVIPGIWIYVLLSLATPALVLERGDIGAALRRSRSLVRGSGWRVFGVLLAAGLLVWVVSRVIQWPFGLDSAGVPGLTAGDVALRELGAAVAQTITVPFVASVTALLYVDQRIRRERLDLELARAAEQE